MLGQRVRFFSFHRLFFFLNKLVINRKTKIVYTPVKWLIWIWLKSTKLSSKRIVPTYQEAHKAPRLTPPGTSCIPYLYSCSWAFSAFSSLNTSTVSSLFLPEEEFAKMDMPNHTLRTFCGREHLLGTFHSAIEDCSVWYPVLLPPYLHPLTQQEACSFTTLAPILCPPVSVRCPW